MTLLERALRHRGIPCVLDPDGAAVATWCLLAREDELDDDGPLLRITSATATLPAERVDQATTTTVDAQGNEATTAFGPGSVVEAAGMRWKAAGVRRAFGGPAVEATLVHE